MRRVEKRKSSTPLEALPLSAEETWQGGCEALSTQVRNEEHDEPYHPELVMWVIEGDGSVLATELAPPGEGGPLLVSLLQKAMRNPVKGRPRRPGKVLVTNPEDVRRVRQMLDPLGVEVEQVESMAEWQSAFDFADSSLNRTDEGYSPATEEHAAALAGLFRAAAAFYRAQPWEILDGWRPLGLEIPSLPGATFGLTVMGGAGENRGLAVFMSVEAMNEFYDVAMGLDFATADPAELPPSIAVSFSTADEMPEEAIAEIKERGWELAAEEAYPMLLRTEPGAGVYLDLSPDVLTLVTIALQAVTRFWSEAEEDLRAGRPSVIREVEVELPSGAQFPVRITTPPAQSRPPRRERKPARGPRRR